ncbi:MAG: hypothetical protein EA382_04500 [Spirochaetaceae bacterium]|nr:MAG: hypothetical protein EA382_04500 [Spirochaetaceae bacterium]
MKRAGFRIAFQTVAVLLLLATALFVLGPVRVAITRQIDDIRDEAIARLEQVVGRRVSFGSVSPSILNFLSIRDLVIHGRAGEPEDLLRIDRLRVYYRPLRMIRREFADAFTEVRVENTTIVVDSDTFDDLEAIVRSMIGGDRTDESDRLGLPDALVVSGRNLSIHVHNGFGRLAVTNGFFRAELNGTLVELTASGIVSLADSVATALLTDLSGRIELEGSIDVDGDTIAQVTLTDLSSNLASIGRQVIYVRRSAGVLEARNVQSRDPIDLYIRYIDGSDELYARVLADGYRLDDVVELRGELARFNRYLALPLRGQANVTVRPGSVSYGASLSTSVSGFDELPDGTLRFQISGDSSGARIDELVYASDIGEIAYQGRLAFAPLRPDGVLTLRNVGVPPVEPISATVRLTSTRTTIAIEATEIRYAGIGFEEVAATLVFDPASGQMPDDPIGVPTGLSARLRYDQRRVLEIESSLDPGFTPRTVSVNARRVDPRQLIALHDALALDLLSDLPDISALPETLVIDTRFRLDLTDGLVAVVPLVYAYDSANPDDHLSFSLLYDNGSAQVRDVTAGLAGYSGSGNFAVDVRPGGDIRFVSDVRVQGIPYEFEGTFRPGRSLELRGLYDVYARIALDNADRTGFVASGNVPVSILPDQTNRIAFDVAGHWSDLTAWEVDVRRLQIDGLTVEPVTDATVAIEGTATPAGLVLRRLSYEDRHSRVAGDGRLAWNLSANQYDAAIELRSPPTAAAPDATLDGERYTIYVSVAGRTVSAAAEFTDLPLLRVGIDTIRGGVTGSLSLTGTLDDPELLVEASLVNGRFNNDPAELRATVAADRSGIIVDNATGRLGRTRAEGVQARVDLSSGELLLDGRLIQRGDTSSFSVGVSLIGTMAPGLDYSGLIDSDLSARVALSGFGAADDEWAFDITRHNRVTSIVGGPTNAIEARIHPDGSFTGRVGAPLPFAFDAVGFIDGGEVEVDLLSVSADLPRVWDLLQIPMVAFTSGAATGSARIVGPVNDPDFFGTLVVDNITGAVDWLPDQLGPTRTFIVFDEKVMTIRDASVAAGPGRATVGAVLVFDRWVPEQFQVQIVTADSGIRLRAPFGRVVVDGMARGDLRIGGTQDSTSITGNLLASQMSVTLGEMPPIESLLDDPPDVRVDVALTTGRGVQFLWPSETFPILRGIADPGQRIRINYGSASDTFSVVGSVAIQGGEVFYFDRSFYIQDGRITFDESQAQFDPLLTVSAEIREVAQDGPIRIYLIADERPLSEFTPRWRSDPPLTEAAILSLLGSTVFITDTGEPINLSQAVLLTSDVVSQFGIIRGFENTVRDALQLDLFSIRTQLFQNLLRGVIDQGQDQDLPLDSGTPSLGEYLNNTTLFAGKYLGNDLFLELLVQLRQARPAFMERQSLAGVEIESELTLEWDTPFFGLEWGFFPRDPSSLFLTDHTFRFSWGFSY